MTREIRVLHETWSMGIGGIETYLMNAARRLRERGVRMDFLVHAAEKGFHEDEIAALGGRVFRAPEFRAVARDPFGYFAGLDAALSAGGPYDVVQSHYDVTGPMMFAAWRRGVPVRVVHSHSEAPELRFHPAWRRKAMWPITRGAIGLFATDGIAVSGASAAARFGPGWRKDPRWFVGRCGVDLGLLRDRAGAAGMRERNGIPSGARVIVHIGRFGPAKNHGFLLETASALKARGTSFRLVLLGDGPLHKAMAKEVARLRLGDEVVFAGFRNDVGRWLSGAADLLLFPSLFEGLPLAVIEAQAAGVPVLMSDRITAETVVVPGLVRTMPLEASAAAWAGEAERMMGEARVSPEAAWEVVAQSPFNIENAAEALYGFYRRALARRR